ncbi:MULTISPECIES: hypothetical protein [unclassified Streptomyces]|uniref:hypothetical protein n=1 Tax=unclassified Streptomyces TaxID=2593676 RepID=UPI00382B8BBB
MYVCIPADLSHLTHTRRIVSSELRRWRCPRGQIEAAEVVVTELAAPLCRPGIQAYDLTIQPSRHHPGAVTLCVGVRGELTQRDIPIPRPRPPADDLPDTAWPALLDALTSHRSVRATVPCC